MNSQLDLSERALAESPNDLVGANALFRLDPFLERRLGRASDALGRFTMSRLRWCLLLLGSSNVGGG